MAPFTPIPHLAAALKDAESDLNAALAAREKADRVVEIKRAVFEALRKLDPSRAEEMVPLIDESMRSEAPRGKAPGSLGARWRKIMQVVVQNGNSALTPDLWAVAAETAGYPMETKRARDWLRRATEKEHHYIQRVGDGYRVSDAAIEKFKLRNQPENESAPSVEGAESVSIDKSAAFHGESTQVGT